MIMFTYRVFFFQKMHSKLFILMALKNFLQFSCAIIPIFKGFGIKLGFGFNFTLNSDSLLHSPNGFLIFISH